MKQKMLVVMLLCALCMVGRPLTVSAETSGSLEVIPPDVSLDDTWSSMSDYGFANDMMIVMSVYDGLTRDTDTFDQMLDNMHILSAPLEAGHFYQITLDFMCSIDQSHLEKYEDINLQVRFPNTLLKNSPNAIGYSVNGSAIDTWCDTFGISSEETLDLYYLEGSGEVSGLGDGGQFAPDVAALLFTSAEGAPIAQIFENNMEHVMDMDGYQIMFFQIEFTLYAAPHEGSLYYDDVALNYWAGQELMYAITTTSAPEAFYRTAVLEENGTVTLQESESDSSYTDRFVNVALVIALVIIACVVIIATILIIIDRRKAKSDPVDYWQGKE